MLRRSRCVLIFLKKTKRVPPIPKRAIFERSRRELSLDVSVGVSILLVVEQSSLESQSRGCAKAPILTGIIPSTAIGSVPSFIRSRHCVLVAFNAERPPAQRQYE